jgi:glycogen(starch) synthase
VQMKILIYSRVFLPSVGGVETMMAILAEEFTAAGHQVKVATQTTTSANAELNGVSYKVVRAPHLTSLLRLLRWADVCLCANVSLRGLGPMLLAGTPVVISHQNFYGGGQCWSLVEEIKKRVTLLTKNICLSHAVQALMPGPSVVIPNSYRSEVFTSYNWIPKDHDFIFVGRLVSDKGVGDLIDAMGHLACMGLRPNLSIVGDGPERPAIMERITNYGLTPQISFRGILRGVELAKHMATHKVMVVPSRWAEPFGIVALEGIGCGCVVVGTDLGGLPEAIGPCGITVPNGDSVAMAKAMKSLLEDLELQSRCRSGAAAHLARHSRTVVANRYLNILESVT